MKTILQNPGLCLALMSWWILVLFFDYVFNHRITGQDFGYVLAFCIAFVGMLTPAAALHVINVRYRFWQRMGHLGKYLILNGCYALSSAAILAVIFALYSYYGAVFYSAAVSDGSFAMGLLPMMMFYVVAGALVCGVLSLRRVLERFRKS